MTILVQLIFNGVENPYKYNFPQYKLISTKIEMFRNTDKYLC